MIQIKNTPTSFPPLMWNWISLFILYKMWGFKNLVSWILLMKLTFNADMVELVDTTDLKSVEIISRAGSSPAIRTKFIQ